MSEEKDIEIQVDGAFVKEALLELVEIEQGKLVLKDINSDNEPLVCIDFSDKVIDMLGDDVKLIGQHMIHSAIQLVMHKQMNKWHANVYDQEPTLYS